QDYIEKDGLDIRVVIIGNKAVAVKRLIRDNDCRASGSGNLVFENENIDKRFIQKAFEIAEKIRSQSLALDFILSKSNIIYLVEISYGFPMFNFLDGAAGYWNKNLQWTGGKFNLQGWMVEGIIQGDKK